MSVKDKVAPIFRGTISQKAGSPLLQISNPDAWNRYLVSLGQGEVRVVVRRHRGRRSDPQNSYYWGVVVSIFAEFTGYTKDEAHEALKIKFLSIEKKGIKSVRSTATLDKNEFGEYVASIQEWASSEFGLVIPDPNDVDVRE